MLPRRILAELFLTEGGLIAGHPGTPRGLEALLDFLPRSIECHWAVACYGASNLELARIAIERGGHVAIGLGDYAYPELAGGQPTNAEVVAEVAAMAKRAGRELATPADVRKLLLSEEN